MWNPLFIWSLKAGLILSFLFAAYYLLFKNNTQFQLKRVLQIVILLAAISFPLIKISVSNDTIPTVYAFQQLDNSLTKENPVPTSTEALLPISEIEIPVSEFSRADIIWWIYLAGVSLSALIILIELTKLSYLVFKGNRELNLGENVISHPSVKYPFSFMKWIFVPTNSEYTDDDWRIIQAHENLHLNQRHTLDILFASFTQCLLWYHPAVYLIQRSMKSNHEALADSAVLASTPYNKYSKTLLALSLRTNTLTLSHSFSLISSLSKRLKLMKTQKTSNKRTLISMTVLIFLLAAIGIQTVAYGQKDSFDIVSATDAEQGNFHYNDIYSFRDGKSFSSVEIWKKTGNRPDGWLSLRANNSYPLPIVLTEKYKSLLSKLEDVLLNENGINNSKEVFRVELSENKETYLSRLQEIYDYSPRKTEFIAELTVEERLAFFELSKAWVENNIMQVYPDYQLAVEMDVIPLRYLIISSSKMASSKRKFNRDDVFASNEVDVKAEPVGGLDRFLRNVALNIEKDLTINSSDYPEKIEFEFLITSSGNISMVNLITDIPDENIKQKQLYGLMKQINDNLIKISELYKWTPALKDQEPVNSKVRIQIPKSLL
uniref:M56 family metallopeptidase n=3 Tax=Roseivirga sp. TaxID=1964215 RepID=UPI004048E8DD